MSKSSTRKRLEKEYFNNKIPFAIDKEKFKRFSERNNIFSRVIWDKNFKMFHRGITEKASKKVGMKGYSRVGYAAQDAAWTVYNGFRRAFDWKSVYPTRVSSPTELTNSLPKYESGNLEENSAVVKRVAQIYGACATGITKLDPDHSFVYTHDRQGNPIELPEGVDNAIVMLIEMDYYAIGTSPALPASITTGNGYSRMAFLVACMAEFLRNLGYQAIPAGNDTALSVPLAVQAGLG
ncbi:MAG: hypothetical protein ACTSPV_15695, partial [Candidatus Hodarchaeales archaeon]